MNFLLYYNSANRFVRLVSCSMEAMRNSSNPTSKTAREMEAHIFSSTGDKVRLGRFSIVVRYVRIYVYSYAGMVNPRDWPILGFYRNIRI